MFYHAMTARSAEDFKRLTGVSRPTFALMAEVLCARLPAFGRPPRLRLEDRLLMVLMYWREYRTQEHIGTTYGVSEATVGRTVKQFESLLSRASCCRTGASTCRAGRRCAGVTSCSRSCCCTRPSGRVSARKKTAALLQRQEEAAYAEEPGGGG